MPSNLSFEPVLHRPRRAPYAETDSDSDSSVTESESSVTESESDHPANHLSSTPPHDDHSANHRSSTPTDPAPPTAPVPSVTHPQVEVDDGLGDDEADPLAIAVPVKRGRGGRGRGNTSKRRKY